MVTALPVKGLACKVPVSKSPTKCSVPSMSCEVVCTYVISISCRISLSIWKDWLVNWLHNLLFFGWLSPEKSQEKSQKCCYSWRWYINGAFIPSPPPNLMIQIKQNDIQTNPKLFLFLQNQNLSDEVLQNSNPNHSSLSIISMRLNSKPFIWALYPLWTSVVWLKMEPGFKPSLIWVVQIITWLM